MIMYGPLEYVLFRFEDDRFIDEILPALIGINQIGCVRVLDIVFLTKDEAGNLEMVEISDLAEEDEIAFDPLINEYFGALADEDVEQSAESLPINTDAALVLFEHRWAIGLQQALNTAGGFLLDSAYINPRTQSEVILEIDQLEVEDAT
jgi:hypothetical protein